jgi:hypothetical protein
VTGGEEILDPATRAHFYLKKISLELMNQTKVAADPDLFSVEIQPICT